MRKKGGYGLTYQEVYLMDNLTIEAKAIYGMLCSYAGSGATVYPSVEFMCKNLHISNTRFYKHMNLLIGAGIVEKIQSKGENGSFANNVYTLVPNLQNVQNPYSENEYTENLYAENSSKGNEGANNNNIKNNSINNNNNINISSEPDRPTPSPSGILLPLNDRTYYDVPLEKIGLWEEVYPAVEVRAELRRMIAWLDSNPAKKKTRRGIERFINSWLARTQDSGGTKGKESEMTSGGNTYNSDQNWEDVKRAIAKATEGKEPGENIFA